MGSTKKSLGLFSHPLLEVSGGILTMYDRMIYLSVPNAILPDINIRVLYLCKQETIAHTGIHRCI